MVVVSSLTLEEQGPLTEDRVPDLRLSHHLSVRNQRPHTGRSRNLLGDTTGAGVVILLAALLGYVTRTYIHLLDIQRLSTRSLAKLSSPRSAQQGRQS